MQRSGIDEDSRNQGPENELQGDLGRWVRAVQICDHLE
jgi:hypothetical protein